MDTLSKKSMNSAIRLAILQKMECQYRRENSESMLCYRTYGIPHRLALQSVDWDPHGSRGRGRFKSTRRRSVVDEETKDLQME